MGSITISAPSAPNGKFFAWYVPVSGVADKILVDLDANGQKVQAVPAGWQAAVWWMIRKSGETRAFAGGGPSHVIDGDTFVPVG